MLKTGNPRQTLFWAHLAVEKILKAHVTKQTSNVAPFTHSLSRLVDLGKLSLNSDQRELLIQLEGFQRTARYDDSDADFVFDLDSAESEELIRNTEEIVNWLIQKL